MLDGVLIGAGDGRYLALSGMLTASAYLPLLWWSTHLQSAMALWTAFALGYIGLRSLALGLRVCGSRWLGKPPLPVHPRPHA